MNERKNHLITARISTDDLELLADLCELINKNKSDTITRAIKFWRNVVDISAVSLDDPEIWGKMPKNIRVHLRTSDSDMKMFNECMEKTGLSISQIVRKAIKAYHGSVKG